jgi:hypothetical protein
MTIFSTVMASIHKRPRSPYYHASFLAPDGRWTLRSTKQTDRNRALAAAMEFERAAKLARGGNLVESQARKILADIMERAGGEETLRSPTVKDYFAQWIVTKQARNSEGTAERYGVAVDNFIKLLGTRVAKPLTSLAPADVERFLNHRTAKGLAPTTVILDVKIIRTALNHARRQGIIPTNPAEAVELPKARGVERGTFTPAEVKILVDTAKDEWKTLIYIAYYIGARLGDCCRTAWADVDLSEGTLAYTQSKTGKKSPCRFTVICSRTWKNSQAQTSRTFSSCRAWRICNPADGTDFPNNSRASCGKRGLIPARCRAAACGNFRAARFMRCGTHSQARWRTRALRRNCG